ncbi:ABC transporter ATP-binding protein [Streptomyces sp. NPDC001939]
MKLLRKPKPADAAVSDSEVELFGGPLRYDMGWTDHEYAALDLGLLSAVRSLPRLVGRTLRLAWHADRRALRTVGATEIGQGITAALSLLVVSAVLKEILGAGTAAERLHAALPALGTGAVIAVLGAICASLSTSAAGRLEPKVERAATEQYLDAAVRVELEAVEDGEFRRLIDKAQYGAMSARKMIGVCVAAVNGVFSLIAAAGVLTVLHWALLPMLILIAAPRGWGAMRVAQRRYVSVMNWVEHVRAARLLASLLTSRTAAPEVRVHGVGRFLLRHYRGMAESAEEESTRLARDKAHTELVAAALSGAAAVLTYLAMGALITGGQMELAIAGTAVVAVRSGSASLGALVMNINQLHEESLYVRDLEVFLEEAARRTIPDGGTCLDKDLKSISLDKVTFQYPDRDAPAVDEVSLTIPMGSVVALVGENGSGKSTLVRLLSGLYLPDSGVLRWGEVDVTNADREQVFDQVALLTQDFERWPLTAEANIRAGRPNQPSAPEALEASAAFSGADRVIASLPNGMQTLIARMFRGACELSGGQWQTIGLARSHFRGGTRLIIVDEPTSALDPEAEIAAFEKIRALATPNCAVVLVTHRMSGVRHADAIYVLHQGRLVEHGTHQALLARGARYASMYQMQAAQYGGASRIRRTVDTVMKTLVRRAPGAPAPRWPRAGTLPARPSATSNGGIPRQKNAPTGHPS